MVDTIPHYGLPHIHCMMVDDKNRLNAYEKALNELVLGKVVLDYGAGTGILSMMAARAGADKVYAVESTNAYFARRFVRDNGLEERISIIEGDIFDVKLPKVDVIVSECMGVFALQENMWPGPLYARDNFLKENGIILPNKVGLYLVPSSELITDIPDFSNIQSFNLSSYMEKVRQQPFVKEANTECFLSDPKRIHSMDILSLPGKNCTYLDLSTDYQLNKNGEITCVYGWFDAEFYGFSNLDTSPKTKTHWQQARFLPQKTISVKEGDQIKIRICSEVSPRDHRRINFKVEV